MSSSDHLTQLRQRRVQLQLRSAAQRQQLRNAVESIDARIRGVEHGFDTVRNFLKRPAVLAGSTALGLLVGPRRVVRLAGRATLIVAAARRLLQFVTR